MTESSKLKMSPVDVSFRADMLFFTLFLALFVGGMTAIAHLAPAQMMKDIIGSGFVFMLVLALSPVMALKSLRQRYIVHALIVAALFAGLSAWFMLNGFHVPMGGTTPVQLSFGEMMLGIVTYITVYSVALWLPRLSRRDNVNSGTA